MKISRLKKNDVEIYYNVDMIYDWSNGNNITRINRTNVLIVIHYITLYNTSLLRYVRAKYSRHNCLPMQFLQK